MPEADFWKRPDVVAQFAARDPDRRLVPLLDGYDRPVATRVLDLGCAAGRNTVLLAQRGFDVHALDSSAAMVEETRRRVAPMLGEAEAERRVGVGRMDDLSAYDDGAFDLVVALGILHNAASWPEWQHAMAEVVRILRPGGRLLVAHFSPDTDPAGTGMRPVPGEPHLFDGLHGARVTLLAEAELDREAGAFGLVPVEPTTVGVTLTETGRRVSVNALYRKE